MMLNTERAAASNSFAGVRFFFPIDELEPVKFALGEHLSKAWSGHDYLGLLPCPCQTHAESIVSKGIPGFYVWHGCAGIFLPLDDMELGAGPYRDHKRDERMLSAICNWLIDLHDPTVKNPVYD